MSTLKEKTMTYESFERFLAASAAGGAIAPTLALIAEVMGGSGYADVERTLAAANEMALAVTPSGYPDPITFPLRDREGDRLFWMEEGEGPEYFSCLGTRIIGHSSALVIQLATPPTASGPGPDAPVDHYRRKAALVPATYQNHVCGETEWAKLARFCAAMDEAVRSRDLCI
jgi:hypothetical protein